jgi:hypothetical protein
LTSEINFFHRDVTTPLPQDGESAVLKRFDEFRAGDIRQFAHTATSDFCELGFANRALDVINTSGINV